MRIAVFDTHRYDRDPAGAATAMTHGTELGEPEEIETLKAAVEIRAIPS